jgi:hypothetical protein
VSEPGYFTTVLDSQFDSQNRLLWLTLVNISEQSILLPRAQLHIPLEQIPGDDEMLDLVLNGLPFDDISRDTITKSQPINLLEEEHHIL